MIGVPSVSGQGFTPKLLRITKRMADGQCRGSRSLSARNSRHYRLGHAARLKLERNLRLAEEMGAKD